MLNNLNQGEKNHFSADASKISETNSNVTVESVNVTDELNTSSNLKTEYSNISIEEVKIEERPKKSKSSKSIPVPVNEDNNCVGQLSEESIAKSCDSVSVLPLQLQKYDLV